MSRDNCMLTPPGIKLLMRQMNMSGELFIPDSISSGEPVQLYLLCPVQKFADSNPVHPTEK